MKMQKRNIFLNLRLKCFGCAEGQQAAKPLDLSTGQVGALFMVVGGTYGLSLPLWGFICDLKHLRNSAKYVEVTGAVLITAGFLLLGGWSGNSVQPV
jgi:hypothetical protein